MMVLRSDSQRAWLKIWSSQLSKTSAMANERGSRPDQAAVARGSIAAGAELGCREVKLAFVIEQEQILAKSRNSGATKNS